MEAFDFADTGQSCSRRNTTTIAPQALTMLNGAFLQEEARAFAERLLREAGPDPRGQIERAYKLALARPPTKGETETALAFLDRQREEAVRGSSSGKAPGGGEGARRALESLCLVILNLNEFLYLD